MRAHTETLGQGPRIGVAVQVSNQDWLQRLRQWFKSFRSPSTDTAAVSRYGTWDAHREKYYPLKAEAAADLVAAQNGTAWSERIYSAAI